MPSQEAPAGDAASVAVRWGRAREEVAAILLPALMLHHLPGTQRRTMTWLRSHSNLACASNAFLCVASFYSHRVEGDIRIEFIIFIL